MRSACNRSRFQPGRRAFLAPALALLALLPAGAAYQYSLADFTGTVRKDGPHLYADLGHDEIYLLHANEIQVFNRHGMEVYRFSASPALGLVLDLVVDPEGDLLVLSTGPERRFGARGSLLTRCDYRGEPIGEIERQGWPARLSEMPVDRLFLRGERLILVNVGEMHVIETGIDGTYRRDWDLGTALGIPPEDRETVRIEGIAMDPDGELLLTIPVMFKVFLVSPEGQVRSFGKGGSAPGLFGIVSGVAADDRGRLFVSDKLRHAVMVFNDSFEFLEEFGYPGNRPENLLGPGELAADDRGNLYVTQRGGRGVSVFSITSE